MDDDKPGNGWWPVAALPAFGTSGSVLRSARWLPIGIAAKKRDANRRVVWTKMRDFKKVYFVRVINEVVGLGLPSARTKTTLTIARPVIEFVHAMILAQENNGAGRATRASVCSDQGAGKGQHNWKYSIRESVFKL